VYGGPKAADSAATEDTMRHKSPALTIWMWGLTGVLSFLSAPYGSAQQDQQGSSPPDGPAVVKEFIRKAQEIGPVYFEKSILNVTTRIWMHGKDWKLEATMPDGSKQIVIARSGTSYRYDAKADRFHREPRDPLAQYPPYLPTIVLESARVIGSEEVAGHQATVVEFDSPVGVDNIVGTSKVWFWNETGLALQIELTLGLNGRVGHSGIMEFREFSFQDIPQSTFEVPPEKIADAIPSYVGAEPGSEKESTRLFPVRLNGKYGYIDTTGSLVIEPQFESAENFSEGFARVRLGGSWGYINSTGRMVFQPNFQLASDFSEGLAWVRIGNKTGFIDTRARWVIMPQFDGASRFYEGLAIVSVAKKKGYIDTRGTVVIEPQFDDAYVFSEGLAQVKIDGKWGYIDKTGKVIVEPQFYEVSSFSEGMAAVAMNQWGYIDTTGKVVIEPQFEMAAALEYKNSYKITGFQKLAAYS